MADGWWEVCGHSQMVSDMAENPLNVMEPTPNSALLDQEPETR